MSRGITQTGGGFAANQDGGGTFHDGIRRAHTDAHGTDGGGGQAADQDRGAAGRNNGTADVRNHAGDHGTYMHVGDARCRRHIIIYYPVSGIMRLYLSKL